MRLGAIVSVIIPALNEEQSIGQVINAIKGVIDAGTKILLTIFGFASGLYGAPGAAADERLIVFTRYPEPGKTKTRLIPKLGAEGAAELHRKMAEHTLRNAGRLKSLHRVSLEVRYEGGSKLLMREWLGGHLTFRSQGDGDLGAKMKRAFRDAFRTGAQRVVIIGTDCPDLHAELLKMAFDALYRNDVVIGPAHDGGYYLIGSRRYLPQLFDQIQWGSEKVLEQTMGRAHEAGIYTVSLTPLSDIDRPEDLENYAMEENPR